MSLPAVNIEQTFKAFLDRWGARILDETLHHRNPLAQADFIFDDKKVIAELKVLKNSRGAKKEFQKSLLKIQKEWVQKQYITANDLQQIGSVTELPERCYKDLEKLYARPVRQLVERANEQIRSTKINQNLSSYSGLLFFSVDADYFLEPKYVSLILGKILGEKKAYQNINTALFFTTNASPIWLTLYRQGMDNVPENFLNSLFIEWASFWGAYYEDLASKEITMISHIEEEETETSNMVHNLSFEL